MGDDETVDEATWRCLFQVTNLPEALAKRNFQIHSVEEVQEVKESSGFPGMLTLYTLSIVEMRVLDPRSPELSCLGLPEGRMFKTHVAASMVVASTRRWKWVPKDIFEQAKAASS